MRTLFTSLAFFLVVTCNFTFATQIKGEIRDNNYICMEIGWKFTIPQGWEIRSAEEIKRVREKGERFIENSSGKKIPIDEIPLLYLFLGEKNRFNSNVSVYSTDYGDYAEVRENTFQMFLNLFKSQLGVTIKSERKQILVDKIPFESLAIIIYSVDGTVEMGRWGMYEALVNGWAFSMNYICADEEAWNTIAKAIENSKFVLIEQGLVIK